MLTDFDCNRAPINVNNHEQIVNQFFFCFPDFTDFYKNHKLPGSFLIDRRKFLHFIGIIKVRKLLNFFYTLLLFSTV